MGKQTFFLFLLSAGTATASSSGYFFAAPGAIICCGSASSTLHFGGGADGQIVKGLSVNVELGALGPMREMSESIGVFSPGVGYHFIPGSAARADPFVTGGYTLLFRGGRANAMHFGGGLNYWFSRKVGLRLEVRDIVESTYSSTAHYVGFRLGIALR